MSDQVTVAEGHDEQDGPAPERALDGRTEQSSRPELDPDPAPDDPDPAPEDPDPAPEDPDPAPDPAPDADPSAAVRTSADAVPATGLRASILSILRILAIRIRSRRHALPPRAAGLLTLLGRGAVLVMIAVAGGWIGAALAPSTTAYVGPLTAQLKVVPSLDPGVTVLLPPAGRVEFDTHVGPLAVEARVSEVDLEGAKELISSPGGLLALERSGPEALRAAVIHAAVVTCLGALTGAVLLSLLWYRRRWLRSLEVAAAMVALLVAAGGVTAVSFDADRFATPRFSGLLSQAPYVAGSASGLLERLESYRSGLADIVQGVTSLYATAGGLPGTTTAAQGDLVTVLHVSDIHLNPLAFDLIDRLVKQFKVDVVVDTGDIVTWGTSMESRTVARIGDVPVPYVYVRGNHDSLTTQQAVGANPNAVVLDGEARQVGNLTVAGIGDPRFTPGGDQAQLSVGDGASGDRRDDQLGAQLVVPGGANPVASARADQRAADERAADERAADERVADERAADERAGGQREVADDLDVAQQAAGLRLAGAIGSWNGDHPQDPVQLAAVHEPTAVGPLLGRVPLVLVGHTHKREVRQDPSGTLVMIEGSTGGAGITSGGLRRLTDGEPLPLSATLIYLAKTGPRRGHVVAYDEVTMGGFGLSSVTLQRNVVRADQELPLAPPAPTSGTATDPSTGAEPTATDPATGAEPTGAEPTRMQGGP